MMLEKVMFLIPSRSVKEHAGETRQCVCVCGGSVHL